MHCGAPQDQEMMGPRPLGQGPRTPSSIRTRLSHFISKFCIQHLPNIPYSDAEEYVRPRACIGIVIRHVVRSPATMTSRTDSALGYPRRGLRDEWLDKETSPLLLGPQRTPWSFRDILSQHPTSCVDRSSQTPSEECHSAAVHRLLPALC